MLIASSEPAEDSDVIINEDGTVDVGPPQAEAAFDPTTVPFDDNLAAHLEDEESNKIAQEIIRLFDEDKQSRADWDKAYQDGISYLGLKQEPRTVPFKDSCGAVHPVLLESIVRFQSNAVIETFPQVGPVDAKVLGEVTEEVTQRAARVKEYMNHVLTDRMETYREDQEQLYFELGYCGSGFKKFYLDENGEPQAKFMPASEIAAPQGFSNIEEMPRIMCTYPMSAAEMECAVEYGRFIDRDLGDPIAKVGMSPARDARESIAKETPAIEPAFYEMIEAHIRLNLPKFNPTGRALPYIVTLERGTEKILSIRRNWEEKDETKKALQWFVDYKFVPGPGFYGYGLLHLIGGLAKSSTSVLRQLVDSGTFANMQGGFYTGVRLKNDGGGGVAPGEWRYLETTTQKLSDSFLPLPTKEPSGVLLQLFGAMVEDARKLGFIADADISVGSGEAPVGTTVALLERQLKVISAVQSRIYRSMAKEFRILKRLIRDSVCSKCNPETQEYSYDVEGGNRKIKVEDFSDSINIVPIADPNAATFGMQMLKYELAMRVAQQFPGAVDQKFLIREYLRFAGVRGVDMIVPNDEHIPLRDAAAENSAALQGQKLRVFPFQPHEAHIATHMYLLQSPKWKEFLGQTPEGPQIMAAMWDHVGQHLAQQLYQDTAKKIGVALPPLGEPIPAQLEANLSYLTAQGIQKLAESDQQEAAMKQKMAEQQDPLNALQREDLAIKKMDVMQKGQAKQAEIAQRDRAVQQAEQTKRMKIATDAQAKARDSEQEAEWVDMEVSKFESEEDKRVAEVNLMRTQILEILARIDQMEKQPAQPPQQ